MSGRIIQKISHREHILKRPDSYVGPTSLTTEHYWVLDGTKFNQKQVTFSPALLKIVDEVLVNAIDQNSLFPKLVKNIAVTVDKETGMITIENDGPLGGISVVKHETENLWNPELTFGHLLTSTNYNDTEERIVGGRNGYGAKLANIYSKKFIVVVNDVANALNYSQTWENNMTVAKEAKVKKSTGTKNRVSISFVPDWHRFGMSGLDDDIFKIIEKRVYDAVVCTSSSCKISFQGTQLEQMSTEDYAKMYLPDDIQVATINSERWNVTIAPSDGFQQISFVNGICTTKGGTHVDHVVATIAAGVIDELANKKLQLKPQNVKNTLFVMVRSTLVNPTFGSQVKSECTLKIQDFGSKFESSSKFIKQVLKTGIQDEIMAVAKLKELKELKKTDGTRKSRITGIPKLDDANFAGTAKSEKCTLIVTEGDSAKTLAVAGLSVVGRDLFGVFPLRGKCKNVRDASVKQLMANQEFNDLKKILGLQQDKEYKSVSELRYGKLMIMTDADNDGSHIKGLILNMIHYFWPSLLKLNFVVSMVTPIIKATKGSETQSFYTDSSFRTWFGDSRTGWKIKYYKGLGTSTSLEAREYFKNIKNLTVAFDMDELTKNSIVLAFDKSKADDRKQWLLEGSEKKSSDLEVQYGTISKLAISEFIHKDLINFSMADLRRSVAHMCDGLKPSQRKVLYACFEKNLREEMKVAQLASFVSEKTSYHHGEVSLAETIVKLAHDFTGSNNMNLLEPCGQFGTRLMGGKDASQTRYIFTKLRPEARELFDPKDDAVLSYLTDDGKKIEPEFFVPVLPTVLINGTEGIGTGFSSFVPPYNPSDIIKNIQKALKGQPIDKMTPWFKGFKGTIAQDSDDSQSFLMMGVYTVNETTVTVTELPPGRWIQDYKEFLDELVEKKTISSYKNNSTTESVHFEIFDYQGSDVVKDLKLSKGIRTSNMHLFHPVSGIKKYSSAEEILVDFVQVRIKYYNMRKHHLIKELTERAKILNNKAKFVRQVVDGDLIIFKRNKKSLEDELTRKFGAYDYLLDIKTYQYTEEAIKKLTDESKQATEELEVLRETQILDMWKMDIKNMRQQ
jgi:DNA topoisomerase II